VTFRRSSGPINRSQRSALTRDGSPPRHPAALSDSFSEMAGTSLHTFASSCSRAPCRPCGIGMSPRRPSVTTSSQNRPCGSCRRDAPPWHPASSHVGLRDAGIRDEVSHFLLSHAHTHAGAPVAMSYTYRLVPLHLRGTCRSTSSVSPCTSTSTSAIVRTAPEGSQRHFFAPVATAAAFAHFPVSLRVCRWRTIPSSPPASFASPTDATRQSCFTYSFSSTRRQYQRTEQVR
jgi:hypothetical protein